jgi:hemerythrin-like domain-containing protein
MTSPGSYNTDTSDMFAVHRALLGSLGAAPSFVARAGDDAERVEAIGSFYENVLEFLHVHHSGEDELLYPLLEQRCGDQLAELVRIDDQHKLLYEPMDVGRSAIVAWRSAPSPDSAQAVVDAMASVDRTLRPHLADEEATVVPLCTTWISPEEWGQLPGHALQSFRADKPWLILGLVFEQLAQEQRDTILAGMPPEMLAVWTEQWRPAFDSFIAEVRS